MNIAIIGATGKAGHFILEEALRRGHDVTAIIRHPEKLKERVPVLQKDIFELTKRDMEAFDVVINAFKAPAGKEYQHVDAGEHLVSALSTTDTRYIVIGGAGSLYTDDTKQTLVKDTPDFPEAFKPTANAQAEDLERLLQSHFLRWTMISPSAIFDPDGARTGEFKIGHDVLLTNEEGESYISYADLAIAVLDEAETPNFEGQRFTICGERRA